MNLTAVSQATWTYATRTLAAGGAEVVDTHLERIAQAVWTRATRQLTLNVGWITQALPPILQAGVLGQLDVGIIDQVLPGVSQAIVGTQVQELTIGQALPGISQWVIATSRLRGVISQALPAIGQLAIGGQCAGKIEGVSEITAAIRAESAIVHLLACASPLPYPDVCISGVSEIALVLAGVSSLSRED